MVYELFEVIDILQDVEQRAEKFDKLTEAKTIIKKFDDCWEMHIKYGDGYKYNIEFSTIFEVRDFLSSIMVGAMIMGGAEV